jgi:hypothetical protein
MKGAKMKSLTRTIIVLVVFNLAAGSFAPAREAPGGTVAESAVEPAARAPVPVPAFPGPTPSDAAPAVPPPAVPAAEAPPGELGVDMVIGIDAEGMPRGHSGRKVLVIPAAEVKAEELVAITQDLQVMSHILNGKFEQPRLAKRAFTDFGDFFGRDSRATEAIYLQGYGVLFFKEVNFTFSPPPKTQEKQTRETENVDPTWQRAKQEILSPKDPALGIGGFSEQESTLVKVEELKTDLVKTLKHAANIRNLKPDEWLILTVIGQAGQPSRMYGYKSFGNTAPTPTPGTPRSGRSSSRGGGGFGGRMSGFVAGSSSSTRGRTAGGMYGGMGGMMDSGTYGGMATYPGTISPSSTVLTIRAKKSDVDDFAKEELDFEQFQEKVQIFTY